MSVEKNHTVLWNTMPTPDCDQCVRLQVSVIWGLFSLYNQLSIDVSLYDCSGVSKRASRSTPLWIPILPTSLDCFPTFCRLDISESSFSTVPLTYLLNGAGQSSNVTQKLLRMLSRSKSNVKQKLEPAGGSEQ